MAIAILQGLQHKAMANRHGDTVKRGIRNKFKGVSGRCGQTAEHPPTRGCRSNLKCLSCYYRSRSAVYSIGFKRPRSKGT